MAVWNVIHHNIEVDHNVTDHSYPDPNYQQNVLDELEAQGVTAWSSNDPPTRQPATPFSLPLEWIDRKVPFLRG